MLPLEFILIFNSFDSDAGSNRRWGRNILSNVSFSPSSGTNVSVAILV